MLKHGILGLLNYSEKTGYELMLMFKKSLCHFWSAQTSQIYRELQALEKNGFVQCRHVEQYGKPDKNVFSITDSGREELISWLVSAPLQVNVNKPILMKTFFLAEAPTEYRIQFFRELKLEYEKKLEELEQLEIDAGLTESGDERMLFRKMTEQYGKMNIRMTIDWIEECIKLMEGR